MAAATTDNHLRFHAPSAHLGSAFGAGWFGGLAEGIARFFGTPQYLISQTALVIAWIIFKCSIAAGLSAVLGRRWLATWE